MVLSGLKTLLETGEFLTTPGSVRRREGNVAANWRDGPRPAA
jgi:hypothetical protein